MTQDERFDTSIVFCCGQWDLGRGTAQRRLLENSATSLPAGLQKKVSINTPVLVIFFGRPIYLNVTKLNYFWQSFLWEILLVLQNYIDSEQTFFIAYLARILTVFGRKETNALGDADDNGCTFATESTLYTERLRSILHNDSSHIRCLQTTDIVSCFISTSVLVNFCREIKFYLQKKVYPANQKMRDRWPKSVGRRSSWRETSWSDSVLAVASSQTMFSAKLAKSLTFGTCITCWRCKYCRSSSRKASTLFDSTTVMLCGWKKNRRVNKR